MNPQKILALIEVILELEDIAQIPSLSKEDLVDQKHALREFDNLFRSLVLEVLNEKK